MSFPYLKSAIITMVVIISVFLVSFSESEKYSNVGFIETNLAKLDVSFLNLDIAADNFRKGKIGQESLQQFYLETRSQYKKVEFYLAFYHSDYVTSTINGAPLLHLERGATTSTILEPEGLQVLDELIYSDDAETNKHEIAAFAKKLSSSYRLLYNRIGKRIPTHSNDVAVMRIELIRIISLGITGFDTPGSLNVIADAKSALAGLKEFSLETKNISPSDASNIAISFENAIAYLNTNQTFESLDRLVFIKLHIDPIYKKLGELSRLEEIDLLENITSWNPKSKSIFATDFLNPYFFTKLSENEDSKNLKDLGEMLFFDPIISSDGKISCASCHNPEKSFTDAVPKSLSNVQGKFVLRNSPTLLNAAYSDRYFYDLRAFTLEQQAEHVIFNPEEFNTAYLDILEKLNQKSEYKNKFKEVFGTKDISRENFSKALASYVLSLKSFNSPFDQYIRGETNTMSQKAKNGFNLFMGKANCATCHFAPTFSGLVPPFYSENESEILGVLDTPEGNNLDQDQGRIANKIQSENAWIYEKSFKTVTVRNSEGTAPYFHNGAYQTLEQVMAFYNEGGGQGVGLSVQNQTLAADKLSLTDVEIKEIIAFIGLLNDNPYSK